MENRDQDFSFLEKLLEIIRAADPDKRAASSPTISPTCNITATGELKTARVNPSQPSADASMVYSQISITSPLGPTRFTDRKFENSVGSEPISALSN